MGQETAPERLLQRFDSGSDLSLEVPYEGRATFQKDRDAHFRETPEFAIFQRFEYRH